MPIMIFNAMRVCAKFLQVGQTKMPNAKNEEAPYGGRTGLLRIFHAW
jgi:hypothetical protein